MTETQDFPVFGVNQKANLDETQLIAKLLCSQRGTENILIDVGAHFGSSLQHFLELDWTVYAYEPDNANRKKLIRKFGKEKNLRIDNQAVSDRVGDDLTFYTSKESTGISGLLDFHDTHQASQKVTTTTVKEIVADHNLSHIDFLKIDVEGYDFSVLKGVPWSELQPQVIECEFEDAKTLKLGHTWKDIANFLVDLGYSVWVSEWHPIVRYGIRHSWRTLKSYPCELDNENCWGNLLAFRSPVVEADLLEALGQTVSSNPGAPAESRPATNVSAIKVEVLDPFSLFRKAQRKTVDGELKVSVITPSYNQSQFLPITLESVAGQTYKNVEHIVIDPGSTDGSVDIARAAKGVTLICEPDNGQAEAINKGFDLANGDILCWLNSDDYYPSDNVLEQVMDTFASNPEVEVVYGASNFVDKNNKFLRSGFVNKEASSLMSSFQHQVGIIQPSVFFRKSVLERSGALDTNFEFTLDYEFWVRLALSDAKWIYLDSVLSHHRWWENMKTASRRGDSYLEHFKTVKCHFGYVHEKWIERYAEYLLTGMDGIVSHSKSTDEDLHTVMASLHLQWNSQFDVQSLFSSDHNNAEITKTFAHYQAHCGYTNPVVEFTTGGVAPSEFGDTFQGKPTSWQVIRTNGRVVYSVPGEFHCELSGDWHERQEGRLSSFISDRNQTWAQERTCVIVGNGPSLNKSDWSLLTAFDVIISNFAFYDPELLSLAKYFTVTNRLVAQQGSEEINALQLTKIFPAWLSPYFAEDENTFFTKATLEPKFSKSIDAEISWRSTVSFYNLQLAYSLGYTRVILVGFDHEYEQPANSIEGQPIYQADDDVNHFRADYFKGREWQAADVGQMEAVYQLAKEAFESEGRKVVNCTVGGKLEVFDRSTLEQEFLSRAKFRIDAIIHERLRKKVRVLVLSSSEIGAKCATGAIKKSYFDELVQFDVFQIYSGPGASPSAVRSVQISDSDSYQDIYGLALHFQPDVVYFRPSEKPVSFFSVCCKLVNALGKPVVCHIMDDWVAREDLGENRNSFQERITQEINSASARLAISPGMAEAYKNRYGHSFFPLANFQKFRQLKDPVKRDRPEFTVRYCGALDATMNDRTIQICVDAVESLNEDGLIVKFEIFTMPWYLDYARSIAKSSTSVSELVDESAYPDLLASSDLLLIGYNFDEISRKYVRYSLANKLADYAASFVPIVVVGPPDVETVRFCKERSIGVVCTSPTLSDVKDVIRSTLELDAKAVHELTESTSEAYAQFCDSKTSPRFFEAFLVNSIGDSHTSSTLLSGALSKLKFSYRRTRFLVRKGLAKISK